MKAKLKSESTEPTPEAQNLVLELTQMGMEVEQHNFEMLDSKIFMLHRALTHEPETTNLGHTPEPLLTDEQRHQVQEKYFQLLLSL